MDLRVEDNPHPIQELERRSHVAAYRNVDQGDAYATEGKIEDAMKAYAEGARLARATTRSCSGRPASRLAAGAEKEATPIFRKVFAHDHRWVDWCRAGSAGLLKDDPAFFCLLKRISALAPAAGETRR